MTAPRFSDYANSLPNAKADRWDALVAGGVSPDEATRQVELESRTTQLNPRWNESQLEYG